MRTIRLHDTYSGELKELRPRDGRKVGIYACGPTVYGRIHVGNARPFVVFSLLARFLAHEGYEPTLVANITDINDKIYDAARPAGRRSDELAAEMTAHYIADTERLGLGRPDHEPQATLMVDEIVALIEALIERGHAYAVEGDVYFRVRSLPQYGELSHRDVDQMDQGEGMEGTGLKEDPLDFALWKAQKPMEDTAWDAPWGRGRPGWHIECSAMAEATLGAPIEIHGGGNDLIFPHHENEAAQTLAARGEPLAQIWMHNGMLQLGTEKMAKSVGNIRGLAEVLDDVGRDTLVWFFCEGHYRQPLAFSAERLEDAARRVERIRDLGGGSRPANPPRHWLDTATRSSTRSRTTTTRRARWRRWRPGPATPTVRTGRSARSTCARCSGCSGWRTCSMTTRGRRPRSSRSPRAAKRRAKTAISPRPTACATSCGRAAGRSATVPAARS